MKAIQLDEVPPRELFPGAKGRFIHTDNMTVIHWTFEAGSVLPAHSHPHEQVSNFIAGEFDFTVGGETRRVGPGSVVVIAPHVVHSAKAVTETYVMDVFYPVREDYR